MMTRTILHRGQTRRLGEKVRMNGTSVPGNWVYGGICQGIGDFSIIYGGEFDDVKNKHVVHTDTVGEWTGLVDKHKTKIFEGDILETTNNNSKYWIVEFKYGCFVATQENARNYSCPLYQLMDDVSVEVAGNIYDNPELLSAR